MGWVCAADRMRALAWGTGMAVGASAMRCGRVWTCVGPLGREEESEFCLREKGSPSLSQVTGVCVPWPFPERARGAGPRNPGSPPAGSDEPRAHGGQWLPLPRPESPSRGLFVLLRGPVGPLKPHFRVNLRM